MMYAIIKKAVTSHLYWQKREEAEQRCKEIEEGEDITGFMQIGKIDKFVYGNM